MAGSRSGPLLNSFLTLFCNGKVVVTHPLSDKERRMIVNILHHDLQGPERNNVIKATFLEMLQKCVRIAFNQSSIVKKLLYTFSMFKLEHRFFNTGKAKHRYCSNEVRSIIEKLEDVYWVRILADLELVFILNTDKIIHSLLNKNKLVFQ
jgi:hypothetical protein